MDKRATEEGLSFLIGLILVILFLVPLGIYGYNIFKERNRLDSSLDFLAKNLSYLQSGQNNSMLLYTGHPNDFLLIGFDTGERDFGGDGIWTCGKGKYNLVFTWQLEKPKLCGKKPCICFCPLTADTLRPGVCSSDFARCELVDADYELKFVGNDECEYGPFIISSSEISNIKLQRHESLIGICRSGECIDLEKQKAITVYNQFVDGYRRCISSENNDCLCDSFDSSYLPEGYRIRIASSNSITKIGLISEEKRLATSTVEDNYLCEYSGSENTRDIPILEISNDEPGIYADGNLVNFYKKARQVTCVAGKKEDNFSYLLQKQSCTERTVAEGNEESVSLT